MTPRRGDIVKLPIGSWYKGRFVDNDREVEGKIVRVDPDKETAFIHTLHGQKPNGCETEQMVWRKFSDLSPVEED